MPERASESASANSLPDELRPLFWDHDFAALDLSTHGPVRVSVLEYGYPLQRPVVQWPELPCQLASLHDLSAMKLVAVAQRGTKKDFVDVYALGAK